MCSLGASAHVLALMCVYVYVNTPMTIRCESEPCSLGNFYGLCRSQRLATNGHSLDVYGGVYGGWRELLLLMKVL